MLTNHLTFKIHYTLMLAHNLWDKCVWKRIKCHVAFWFMHIYSLSSWLAGWLAHLFDWLLDEHDEELSNLNRNIIFYVIILLLDFYGTIGVGASSVHFFFNYFHRSLSNNFKQINRYYLNKSSWQFSAAST